MVFLWFSYGILQESDEVRWFFDLNKSSRAVWRPPGLPPHPRPHHLGRPQRFCRGWELFRNKPWDFFMVFFSWGYWTGDFLGKSSINGFTTMENSAPKHYDDTFTGITGTAPPSSLWQSSTLPLEMAMGMIGKSPRNGSFSMWNYQKISVCKSGNCLKIQWFVSMFIIISPSKIAILQYTPIRRHSQFFGLLRWLFCFNPMFEVYRGWFLGMGCDGCDRLRRPLKTRDGYDSTSTQDP